jgi:hypothetical protein
MTTKKTVIEDGAAVQDPAAEKFLWLAETCNWSGRVTLEHGKAYEARLIDADVLKEWIRTGAAVMTEDKEK